MLRDVVLWMLAFGVVLFFGLCFKILFRIGRTFPTRRGDGRGKGVVA